MQVVVNGQPEELADDATLGDLVAKFELAPKRIAIEVNQELVPRETYDRAALKDGDCVEIVTFVGGG